MVLPNHVAIIPDGNRRWAKEKKLPTLVGHRQGFKRAVEVVRLSRKWGIHAITMWAFSTENWKRSEREVAYLMKLFNGKIDEFLNEAHEWESRIVHLGRKDRIPRQLASKISQAEKETSGYKRHVLNIGLDYNGRDEVLRAVSRLLEVKHKKHKSIKTKEFERYLDTRGQRYPYPDLIIRTSGELRTSGLLLWQAAYSEFYFEKSHFPDFTAGKFRKAILEYGKRKRRFGGN